jgi:hypothetical protein
MPVVVHFPGHPFIWLVFQKAEALARKLRPTKKIRFGVLLN